MVIKKALFIIIITFISISISAQKKNEIKISEKIKSALLQMFPDVKNIQWNKNKDKTEAAFNYQGKNISVEFTGNEFFFMKTQIQPSEIPKAVNLSLNEYYNGYHILNVDLIRDSKNGIYYGLELMKTSVKIKVIFDQYGKLTKSAFQPN